MQDTAQTPDPIQIDIVSDVMCPWCIVGYRQLEQALEITGYDARLTWHPFELNPRLPAEGQNLQDHMAEKYGASPAQSAQTRARLSELGDTLGITFNFTDESRIHNTFSAHQLLDWAQSMGHQHDLKCALFEAYFTDGCDISDHKVLSEVAHSVGLDAQQAAAVLASGSHAPSVREKQRYWTSRGISGVPAMVFGGKFLVSGAQGAQNYAEVLHQTHQDRMTQPAQ